MPPFDNAGKKSKEDDFNYYHSSARITVECAFGEIDLRWGIFWKRLCCSLEHTVLICKGAMHLHNFLVDYRNENSISSSDEREERDIFISDYLDNRLTSGVIGNDPVSGIIGRPPNKEQEYRLKGKLLRDLLRDKLRLHSKFRVRKDAVRKYDNSNHVYYS